MKNIFLINTKRGFTLIEMMVVIAIIGILTAIVTANLVAAKSKTRDAKRVSDLSQIQIALEMAFDRCNAYPPNITNLNDNITMNSSGAVCTRVDSSGQTVALTLGYFITAIPKDPDGTNYTYSLNNYTDYVLRAKLENNNRSVLEDASDIDGIVYGYICSDTDPNFYYCVQPK